MNDYCFAVIYETKGRKEEPKNQTFHKGTKKRHLMGYRKNKKD